MFVFSSWGRKLGVQKILTSSIKRINQHVITVSMYFKGKLSGRKKIGKQKGAKTRKLTRAKAFLSKDTCTDALIQAKGAQPKC